MALLHAWRAQFMPAPADALDLQRWRDRILQALLKVVFALGTLTAIPSVWQLARMGLWRMVVVDLASVVVVGVLAFRRSLPYRVRAYGLLALCYLLGVTLFLAVGYRSQIYLIAVPVLAAALLGSRPALVAYLVNAVTMVALGVHAVDLFASADTRPGSLAAWLVVTLNFLFVSTIMTVVTALILEGLEHSLAREREVARSHDRLARAVEQSQDVVLISDLEGRVVYANHSYAEVTGIAADVQGPDRLQDFRTAAATMQPLDTALSARTDWRGTVLLPSPDGGERQFDAAVLPLRDAEDTVVSFVAALREVTHERALEARIRQSEKLEAIGTLAGGIAHDFNNIIGSILGMAEVATHETQEAPTRESLSSIVVACHRARDVVRQLLTFSRQSGLTREPLALRVVVEEALPLLRAVVPPAITFRLDLTSTGTVIINRTEIHQVLLNLVGNACHAMADVPSAVLTLTLYDVVPDAALVARHPRLRRDARYLKLGVRDTGTGIAPSDLHRIFDPFFSTKPVGVGTGLGLPSVHGIVTALGGEIDVQSEVGMGSTFRIYLPEVPAAAPAAAASPASTELHAASPDAAHPRVLIVDDEAVLLEGTRRGLLRQGFEVAACADGAAASELLSDRSRPFDLLLTDFNMSGVSGLDLVRHAHAVRPKLPIILTSGFIDASQVEGYKALGVTACLQKPYTQGELLAQLRETLGEAAPER